MYFKKNGVKKATDVIAPISYPQIYLDALGVRKA
jgi:hypothetical protein